MQNDSYEVQTTKLGGIMFKLFNLFKPKKAPREESHPVKMTRDPYRIRSSRITPIKKCHFPKITEREE